MFSKRICCCHRRVLSMMKNASDRIIPSKWAQPCRKRMKMLHDNGGYNSLPHHHQDDAGRYSLAPACCVMHQFYSCSVTTCHWLEVREKWQSFQKMVEVFITVPRKQEMHGEVKTSYSCPLSRKSLLRPICSFTQFPRTRVYTAVISAANCLTLAWKLLFACSFT